MECPFTPLSLTERGEVLGDISQVIFPALSSVWTFLMRRVDLYVGGSEYSVGNAFKVQ